MRQVVEELFQKNIDTYEYYFEVYEDEYSSNRYDLHDKIILEIIQKKEYTREKQIFMLGGAPANGKSSFIKSGIISLPRAALQIDPDEIKKLLPEYEFMRANDFAEAAAKVHEESSHISKEIRLRAIQDGLDLILDGVANDTLERRREDLMELTANGHSVRIDYVTLDTDLSLKLASLRFQETGRQVPNEYIKDKNRQISVLVPELIEAKLFDELWLWDTNDPGRPRLILSQKKGKLVVENNDLFDRFKAKANEQ